jgi:BASS family bile acid:Na+ symporter
MSGVRNLFRNRDLILILALVLGFIWRDGAHWAEKAVLPALALIMTIATSGISGLMFLSPRKLLKPTLVGLAINYGILGSLLLGLNALFIRDGSMKAGFVILAAVPPAVAVIPFAVLLNGNGPFSLIATVGSYLGALILTPLITVIFLGSGFVNPERILIILIELILAPLFLSRILVWSGIARKIEPVRGAITNWGFFLVTYAVVGLNRDAFLSRPLSLVPAILIVLISTFGLGLAIEAAGRCFRIDQRNIVTLLLLGTQKNTGLAAGLAFTLFDVKTAMPSTIGTIIMLGYIIWLSFKNTRTRRKGEGG